MAQPPLPTSLSLPFLEGLYVDFQRDPGSVPPAWRSWFEGLEDGGAGAGGPTGSNGGAPRLGPSFRPASLFHGGAGRGDGSGRSGRGRRTADLLALQDRVDRLVRAYRVRAHLVARTNPLDLPLEHQAELDPEYYGFGEEDLDLPVSATTVGGEAPGTLGRLLERLRNTYCRSIGAQFMHIDELNVREWLQQRMEGSENRLAIERGEQLRILTKLTDAVIFEEFIQKKYLGAKSFSLEGSESLIPLLELAIEKAASQGVDEIVLGMAHRGRLNVLANCLRKHPRDIFREFEDTDPELHMGRGDVKYHLGFSTDRETRSGRRVHLSLCFNPSHLEFVNPVALGRMRAKQDRAGDRTGERGMVLLIHGDAAFIGEGVTQETLNLSELDGYGTGGTIHVIVNNQIGFTTSPTQARSSTYCTDVAKMLQSPIFHVNGEDPEAVAQVIDLALDFRARYRRDVVIDMYGYRRRGHNEGDEPSFTDPVLYQAIGRRQGVREGYLEHLLRLGEVTQEEADEIAERRRHDLEEALGEARREDYVRPSDSLGNLWEGFHGGSEAEIPRVETGVEEKHLKELLVAMTRTPDGFRPHPKLERGMRARREMAEGERPLDWAAAEALAFATLAVEGHRVRLSGQDSQRGTFSHRHAVLHDVNDGHTWEVFQHLAPGQAPVEIYNSPLSEVGVLGFEYGYSLDCPDGLVVWEAQFGDFVNAAQVIVDQFIVSAEDKWARLTGLVMLLPHGFEGQGPEHSSARLERFLMLASEENIQVVNLSTPANFFHCLRRQGVRPWRKPLIVMTPKSLLRHPQCVSPLADLTQGGFRRVIPDARHADGEKDTDGVRRILLACGKIAYELLAKREEDGRDDVAIVRVEQLYPFPEEDLREVLAAYPDGTPVAWVQEEPCNMGAWPFLRGRYCAELLGRPFFGLHRQASASPATGSKKSHDIEQNEILNEAFDLS